MDDRNGARERKLDLRCGELDWNGMNSKKEWQHDFLTTRRDIDDITIGFKKMANPL